MSELFQIEESLSPRLKWMREHRVSIIDNGQDFRPGDECPETGAQLYRFCAHNDHAGSRLFFEHRTGYGDTEDEAVANFARKHGLRLWNETLNPNPDAA